MQTLKLKRQHSTTLEVGGEPRAMDLMTGATEKKDTQPGAHTLKPAACSDKTAVSFSEALCICANAQVGNFGAA